MTAEKNADTPKTILITGASRGIGAATARLCGARGWNVGVNYRSNAAEAEKTVAAVIAAGGQAAAIPGDVAEEADILAMFDQTAARYGRIDGVVVNAGILDARMQLADMSADRIRRVIAVNVTGALLTAREAARRLSTKRGGAGGSIVITSSRAAPLGSPNEFIDYAASKGAMDTLTLGLSKELGPEGVRVNNVRPGLIETDIHHDAGWPERAETLSRSGVPMGRPGTADETAEAILWLLSGAASYVTGAMIDVGGGR